MKHSLEAHDQELVEKSADTLRAWALDEELKRRVMTDPVLADAAYSIARRYTAGPQIDDAIKVAQTVQARGHNISIDYAGESVRDADVAVRETSVFLRLIDSIAAAGLPSTVSFDLTHVGALIEPDLGRRHARELAAATAAIGTSLMISAEGSDRTDLVLDLYEQLSRDYSHVGVTLQARLHRTPDDLDRVMALPGTVRLVKGSFLEPDRTAHRRATRGLSNAYLELAGKLVEADHPCSIATHDETLIDALLSQGGQALQAAHVEFEMLMGLGTDLLDRLHAAGFHTREYVIFGGEWWLYVLNRIAEEPRRILTALADLNPLVVHRAGRAPAI